MTDRTRHNGQDKSLSGDYLDRFSSDEREEIKEIWEKSGLAAVRQPEITEDETEQALSSVHKRLGFDEQSNAPKNTRSATIQKLRWYLAAAVILFVIGAGYLVIPKSFTVPYGELATVELPDGSVVEMNSGTRLWHNRLFSHLNRSVHLDGEAYFTVEPGEIPFIVNANEAVIEVTSTRFNVRSWSSDPGSLTNVTVSDGEIRFYPLQSPDRSVTLNPGKMSLWAKNMDEPAEPEPVPLDRFLGWRDNMLIFNEKPLIVILNELERKYDARIELEEPGVQHETLTTYYTEHRELESVLKDICLVKGLRFSQTVNGYRIYK